MWNDLLDLTFISSVWEDVELINIVTLEALFEAANEVCAAYAPVLPAGYLPSMSYKLAEIMQARHIWTQFGGGNRDDFGADGLMPATYPLVFASRDLLRPKRSPLSRLG